MAPKTEAQPFAHHPQETQWGRIEPTSRTARGKGIPMKNPGVEIRIKVRAQRTTAEFPWKNDRIRG